MKRAQLFALSAALGLALVLAFALQDVIRESLIIPLAYFWWVLGIYYSAFPQMILWICLVLIVLLMFFGSLEADVYGKAHAEKKNPCMARWRAWRLLEKRLSAYILVDRTAWRSWRATLINAASEQRR
jgi:uncharacterized membrane protein